MSRSTASSRASLVASLCGLLLGGARTAKGQSASNELWPEVDVFWQPTRTIRLFGLASSSRTADSEDRQRTLGIHVDRLWSAHRFVRVGYGNIQSVSGQTTPPEQRALAEVTLSTPGEIMRFVNRARLELRWIGSEQSFRIRERVRAERELIASWHRKVVPYVMDEMYYDSRYRTIDRNLLQVGAEFAVAGHVLLDLRLTREDDTRSSLRHVNAAGATLRLSFD